MTHPGGPEDVIDSRERAGTCRVSDWTAVDGVTELDGPVDDLPTANHNDPLRIGDHLLRPDGKPLPDPSPRPRSGQAMVAYPAKHRQPRAVRSRWWRRCDWALIVGVPCILATIGIVVYLGATGFLAPGAGPDVAATRDELRRVQAQSRIALTLAGFSSVVSLAALFVRRP